MCCQNFKIIVESSLIAHSIGNFVLKNINTERFLNKSDMWLCMTSYLIVWHFHREKIGVQDPLLKSVIKGKIYIYDLGNRILIKFWVRNIYFGIFQLLNQPEKLALKKIKVIPCFLAIFRKFRPRIRAPYNQIFLKSVRSTKSAMENTSYQRNLQS